MKKLGYSKRLEKLQKEGKETITLEYEEYRKLLKTSKYSWLSEEAEQTVISMVQYCLNMGLCMGMDGGMKQFHPVVYHDFVLELKRLCELD